MVNELLIAHAPVAPERLRARVLDLAPAPRSRARRITLVAVPVAAALAVGAAVVHGIAGSGSKPQPLASQVHRAERKAWDSAGTGGSTFAAPAQTLTTALQGKAFVPNAVGSRLQRTAVTLNVRVADAQSATTKAVGIATSLGGYAQSVRYDSSQKTSFLTLRVPVDQAKFATARLAELGTLVSQQLSVDDLQHVLQTQNAQIAQLRRTIAALQKAIADPSLPDAQRVLLRIRLAEAKRSLTQRVHARGGTIAAGANATITLTLTTKHAQGAVLPHPPGRLDRMFHSALGFLALEGMAALYALIAAGPFLVLGWATLLLARARRRRAI